MIKLVCALIIPLFINCQSTSIKENLLSVELDSNKNNKYPWLSNYVIEDKLINRISVPKGYERVKIAKNSFADWLRNIPLKKGSSKVLLYNGNEKNNQEAQFAVVNIDIGNRNLQQCADAVMRLRAEYLFSLNQDNEIGFNFTSGHKFSYSDWKKGIRPQINGNKVSFIKTNKIDKSYSGFKKYLDIIFTYCGTYSLSKELKTVSEISMMHAGDVFIQGGFPGHAVLVVDVAINYQTNEKIFLLSQSYMPAQDIHILKNPSNIDSNPWFSIKFKENLITPEWTFSKSSLKRF